MQASVYDRLEDTCTTDAFEDLGNDGYTKTIGCETGWINPFD